MRELTTITQFGARKSIASLHINKLLKSAKENEKINHIFYLVDPNNKILENYLENIKNSNRNIVLYTRKDNNYTDF